MSQEIDAVAHWKSVLNGRYSSGARRYAVAALEVLAHHGRPGAAEALREYTGREVARREPTREPGQDERS